MGLLYDYHVPVTFGFVKDTRGYVKKAEPKPCLCILNNQLSERTGHT